MAVLVFKSVIPRRPDTYHCPKDPEHYGVVAESDDTKTTITQQQRDDGLAFMAANFPCSERGKCDGCEDNFDALLHEMGIAVKEKT